MIPPFDESGNLPPGIHSATLSEIKARFGRESELRRVQTESINWMVDLALKAGVRRIVLNGSFVADIIEPNDVDCVRLFRAAELKNVDALNELYEGLPFLDMAIVGEILFNEYVSRWYALDRDEVNKGMVEINLNVA